MKSKICFDSMRPGPLEIRWKPVEDFLEYTPGNLLEIIGMGKQIYVHLIVILIIPVPEYIRWCRSDEYRIYNNGRGTEYLHWALTLRWISSSQSSSGRIDRPGIF